MPLPMRTLTFLPTMFLRKSEGEPATGCWGSSGCEAGESMVMVTVMCGILLWPREMDMARHELGGWQQVVEEGCGLEWDKC